MSLGAIVALSALAGLAALAAGYLGARTFHRWYEAQYKAACACIEAAAERGYCDEKMMLDHGVDRLNRWAVIFAIKRSPEWEFWYYHPMTDTEFYGMPRCELPSWAETLELRFSPKWMKQ
jgi:hypothetical protein